MILTPQNESRLNNIEKEWCKKFLLLGYPIIFYTDTVMGIGANGLSKRAVDNIFFLKNRTFDKPLILLLANTEDAVEYIDDPEILEHTLIKDNWPGPLTGVFKKKKESLLYYSKDNSCDTLGIRIPDSEYLRDLIEYLPFPLVTTSANRSQQDPVCNADVAQKEFNKDILVINMRKVITNEKTLPSTVVSFLDSKVTILREGKVSNCIKN
jgi:L-threonylcarbamoyladenylate synthase